MKIAKLDQVFRHADRSFFSAVILLFLNPSTFYETENQWSIPVAAYRAMQNLEPK